MITVHADIATVQDAGHLRINGYLVKPISPEQLGDRLRAIFREREDGSSPHDQSALL